MDTVDDGFERMFRMNDELYKREGQYPQEASDSWFLIYRNTRTATDFNSNSKRLSRQRTAPL